MVLKKLLNSPLFLKILSVILATIIWFFVTYTQDLDITVTSRDIPITYTGTESLTSRDLAILYPDKPATVTVKLKGRRSILMNTVGKISASVDVNNVYQPGQKTMSVDVVLPIDGVQIIDKSPYNIDVDVKNSVIAEVPITIKQTGLKKQSEYTVMSEPLKSTFTIRGPQEALSTVSQAIAIVDVSDVTSTVKKDYSVTLYDENSNEVNLLNVVPVEDKVSIESTYLKLLTVNVVPSIKPATHNLQVGNIKVTPETVVLGIPSTYTRSITQIAVKSHFTPDEAGSFSYNDVELDIPKGVYLQNAEPLANISFDVTDTDIAEE